jgi:hypothetical protein
MRKYLLAILFVAVCSLTLAQQVMNNDGVIKLVKAGLSDDLVVSTINASPGAYDTSADGLVTLKNAGVSDKVIGAVVAKASKTVPVAAPAPSGNSGNVRSESGENAPAPASAAGEQTPPEEGASKGTSPISAGSRIVIAPMGGFETYFAAAVREKKVPITLTLDKSSAQFYVVSTNTEWQGFVYGSGGSASWNSLGGSATHAATASSTRGLEASIMLIDAKTKDVVWAYEVHKSSHGSLLFGTLGARGQQSIAEACAKHLKEYIETGK